MTSIKSGDVRKEMGTFGNNEFNDLIMKLNAIGRNKMELLVLTFIFSYSMILWREKTMRNLILKIIR